MSKDRVNSLSMRTALMEVGIDIDDQPRKFEPLHQRPAPLPDPTTAERMLIREILIEAGAPSTDLEWMTSSCPSVAHARTYRTASP